MFIWLCITGCDLGTHVSELPLPEMGDTHVDDSDPPASADTDLDAVGVEHFVVMRGNAFDPDTLTITSGDTVTWVNEDTWFHIVAEGTPEASTYDWISPEVELGEEWSMAFVDEGDHVYYCWNHAAIMRDAHIIVEAR